MNRIRVEAARIKAGHKDAFRLELPDGSKIYAVNVLVEGTVHSKNWTDEMGFRHISIDTPNGIKYQLENGEWRFLPPSPDPASTPGPVALH